MQYLSAYYWQQEMTARTSLVVQQLMYRKGKIPMLFALLCTGEKYEKGWDNTYFAEQLTEWFRMQGREVLLRSKKADFLKIETMLRSKISQIDKELASYCLGRNIKTLKIPSLAGLLCIGEHFWMFYRGNARIYLLNDRFGRAHCKCLTENANSKLQLVMGEMEEEIGLLVTTEDFGAILSEQQLGECLSVKEVDKRQKGQQRLRELGEEAARLGGRHMGAVLLVTHSFQKGGYFQNAGRGRIHQRID